MSKTGVKLTQDTRKKKVGWAVVWAEFLSTKLKGGMHMNLNRSHEKS